MEPWKPIKQYKYRLKLDQNIKKKFLFFSRNKRKNKMGSATPLRLPVIDFSKEELKPGTEEWESVKSQVRKALEEYGCFEATFNKVPAELRQGIVGAMEELFELPLETKLRNVSKKPFHGYVGQYPQAPLYESMGIDEANVSENVENLTSVLWPQGNPTFRFTIYLLSNSRFFFLFY